MKITLEISEDMMCEILGKIKKEYVTDQDRLNKFADQHEVNPAPAYKMTIENAIHAAIQEYCCPSNFLKDKVVRENSELRESITPKDKTDPESDFKNAKEGWGKICDLSTADVISLILLSSIGIEKDTIMKICEFRLGEYHDL